MDGKGRRGRYREDTLPSLSRRDVFVAPSSSSAASSASQEPWLSLDGNWAGAAARTSGGPPPAAACSKAGGPCPSPPCTPLEEPLAAFYRPLPNTGPFPLPPPDRNAPRCCNSKRRFLGASADGYVAEQDSSKALDKDGASPHFLSCPQNQSRDARALSQARLQEPRQNLPPMPYVNKGETSIHLRRACVCLSERVRISLKEGGSCRGASGHDKSWRRRGGRLQRAHMCASDNISAREVGRDVGGIVCSRGGGSLLCFLPRNGRPSLHPAPRTAMQSQDCLHHHPSSSISPTTLPPFYPQSHSSHLFFAKVILIRKSNCSGFILGFVLCFANLFNDDAWLHRSRVSQPLHLPCALTPAT